MSSIYVLGSRVDNLTMAAAVTRIQQYIEEGVPRQVITLNAEIAYRAYREPSLRHVINSAAMVTADGSGIVWAAGKLGTPLPERVAGIDLFQAIAAEGAQKGWRFFFYGAAPGVAAAAATKLKGKIPRLDIAGTSHGFLKPEDMPALVAAIREAKPHVLLVGLGAPRQEYWIAEHLQELQVPVVMGVGGSFDVLAGVAKRAPAWMRKMNLEWLYRVIKGKRFKRALALPLFILSVHRERRRAAAGGKS